jgi:hypothetical protein
LDKKGRLLADAGWAMDMHEAQEAGKEKPQHKALCIKLVGR